MEGNFKDKNSIQLTYKNFGESYNINTSIDYVQINLNRYVNVKNNRDCK